MCKNVCERGPRCEMGMSLSVCMSVSVCARVCVWYRQGTREKCDAENQNLPQRVLGLNDLKSTWNSTWHTVRAVRMILTMMEAERHRER